MESTFGIAKVMVGERALTEIANTQQLLCRKCSETRAIVPRRK
jgi:hypothetical protein